jgi:hypothetical protein
VEACSALADRAVVSQADTGATHVWVVQLSTGQVLAHYTYTLLPTSTPGMPTAVDLSASRDGSLLARDDPALRPERRGVDYDQTSPGYRFRTVVVNGQTMKILAGLWFITS